MRIQLQRALAAVVAAVACCSGIADAQTYYSPPNVPAAPSAAPYSNYPTATSGQLLTIGDDKPNSQPLTSDVVESSWWQCDNQCLGNWRSNTVAWFGGDAFKSIGDGASGNNAGIVGGFNTGFALGQSSIRAQLGASYGLYDLKGTGQGQSASAAEQQTFITFGVYKRSDVSAGERISWGAVFDQFFGHNWGFGDGEIYLTQLRGIAGYALSDWNELGVWGTVHTNNDSSVRFQNTLRAMNQANVYWRHNFEMGAQNMLYLGCVDAADIGSWQIGSLAQAPLNNYTSLYGNVTFSFPSSKTGGLGPRELEWNIGVGLAYSFGGKAISPTVSGQKGLPLLPVANNGSVLITD
jgi:hypothetical protein